MSVHTQGGASRPLSLAGSLATAIASPALFLNPLSAHAQSSDVPQLLPVQVEGQVDSPYDVKQSASKKFTAPLLDTAKSVQIIPQEVIQNQAASTLTDVLRNSPGITFGAGEGGNPLGDRPFIRGYDAQSSTYVDGLRDIGSTSREVFNLEQVEVIKGSDGAYGGRGGAGGSINLISKTPKAEDFTAASLGIGTDHYYRGTVDGNFMLGDKAAFRLNAVYHDADVPGRNVVDNNRWGVAPSITFGLNTDTRINLSYYHLQTNDIPDSGIPYAYPSTKVLRSGAYQGVTRTGPADVNRHNFYGLTSDFRDTTSDIGTISIDHDFSDRLSVSNKTRYTYSSQKYVYTQPDDSQGNVLNGRVWRRANTRDSDVNSMANQTEFTGKFETGSIKHSFNVGLELSEERGNRDTLNYNRGSGTPGANNSCNNLGAASRYNCTSLYHPDPHDPWVNTLDGDRVGQNSRNKTTTKSLYAFDSIALNEQWQTSFGVRVDDYSTKFTSTPSTGFKVTRRDDTLLNYQLGLAYKPVENGTIYASYATSSTPANASLGEGSETQGITASCRGNTCTGLNAADLSPEKNKTYEVGTKWEVLDRRLTLTGAVFRTETTNARVTLANGDYAMAGKKEVDGLELGFSGALTSKWQVFGGYTFLKSKLKDNGPSGAANDGNDFPSTPRNSLSLWTTYAVLPKLTLGGGAYYVDKQWANPANTAYIPSYWRFDAMAGYQFDKHWNAQLNVLNVFDKTYYDKAYTAHYAGIAPGRSAILSVNLRY